MISPESPRRGRPLGATSCPNHPRTPCRQAHSTATSTHTCPQRKEDEGLARAASQKDRQRTEPTPRKSTELLLRELWTRARVREGLPSRSPGPSHTGHRFGGPDHRCVRTPPDSDPGIAVQRVDRRLTWNRHRCSVSISCSPCGTGSAASVLQWSPQQPPDSAKTTSARHSPQRG